MNPRRQRKLSGSPLPLLLLLLLLAAALTVACSQPAPVAPRARAAPHRARCSIKDLPAEAIDALVRVKEGASQFMQADHMTNQAKLLPKRFPPLPPDALTGGVDLAGAHDTGWTPRQTCCTRPGQRCLDPAAWRKPPWFDLMLQLDRPHRFQVRFVSAGIDRASTFQAEVRVDPRCDGVFCVFRMAGRVGEAFATQTEGPTLVPAGEGR